MGSKVNWRWDICDWSMQAFGVTQNSTSLPISQPTAGPLCLSLMVGISPRRGSKFDYEVNICIQPVECLVLQHSSFFSVFLPGTFQICGQVNSQKWSCNHHRSIGQLNLYASLPHYNKIPAASRLRDETSSSADLLDWDFHHRNAHQRCRRPSLN